MTNAARIWIGLAGVTVVAGLIYSAVIARTADSAQDSAHSEPSAPRTSAEPEAHDAEIAEPMRPRGRPDRLLGAGVYALGEANGLPLFVRGVDRFPTTVAVHLNDDDNDFVYICRRLGESLDFGECSLTSAQFEFPWGQSIEARLATGMHAGAACLWLEPVTPFVECTVSVVDGSGAGLSGCRLLATGVVLDLEPDGTGVLGIPRAGMDVLVHSFTHRASTVRLHQGAQAIVLEPGARIRILAREMADGERLVLGRRRGARGGASRIRVDWADGPSVTDAYVCPFASTDCVATVVEAGTYHVGVTELGPLSYINRWLTSVEVGADFADRTVEVSAR